MGRLGLFGHEELEKVARSGGRELPVVETVRTPAEEHGPTSAVGSADTAPDGDPREFRQEFPEEEVGLGGFRETREAHSAREMISMAVQPRARDRRLLVFAPSIEKRIAVASEVIVMNVAIVVSARRARTPHDRAQLGVLAIAPGRIKTALDSGPAEKAEVMLSCHAAACEVRAMMQRDAVPRLRFRTGQGIPKEPLALLVEIAHVPMTILVRAIRHDRTTEVPLLHGDEIRITVALDALLAASAVRAGLDAAIAGGIPARLETVARFFDLKGAGLAAFGGFDPSPPSKPWQF